MHTAHPPCVRDPISFKGYENAAEAMHGGRRGGKVEKGEKLRPPQGVMPARNRGIIVPSCTPKWCGDGGMKIKRRIRKILRFFSGFGAGDTAGERLRGQSFGTALNGEELVGCNVEVQRASDARREACARMTVRSVPLFSPSVRAPVPFPHRRPIDGRE